MSTTLDLDGETLTLPTANETSWDANLNNTITAIVNKMGGTNPADWNTISVFAGTWTSYGAPYSAPKYRKEFGRVWLKGAIGTGNPNTAAFTLPAGYRPAAEVVLAASDISNTYPAMVCITTAGVVTIYDGAGFGIDSVCFDGLSFSTD